MTKKISFFVLSFLFALFLPLNIVTTIYAEATSDHFCDLTPSGASTGDVVLSSDCVVYENINGVANGNLTITSTVTLHHDLVFYPEYQINIQGIVYVNTGSKIQQGKICIKDADADGYADLIPLTYDPATGEPLQETSLTQIQSEVITSAPYTCSEDFVSRENFSNLALVDSGTNPDVYATGDNIFLQLGFEINGVSDLNAATTDIIVPATKNLILLPGGIGGKIGIGTATPLTPLQITSSSDNSASWWLDANASILSVNNNPYGTSILKLGGARGGRIVYGGGTSNDKLIFSSRLSAGTTTQAVTIDSTGNVGIGLTTDNYFKLNVAGSQFLSGNLQLDNGFFGNGGMLDQEEIGIYGGGDETIAVFVPSLSKSFYGYNGAMTIQNDGKVGIGNSSPGQKLDVAGTGKFGAYALIGTEIAGGYYQDINNGAYRANGTTGNRGYYFQSNAGSSTAMYVGLAGTYANKVGVNTTGPTNSLHTYQAVFSPPTNDLAALKVEGSWGGGIVFSEGTGRSAIFSGGGTDLRFATNGTSTGFGDANGEMIITNTGNVGIGTASPTAKLHITTGSSATLQVDTPTGSYPTINVGRYSGQPSIKSTSDWLIMDSNTAPAALNYFSNQPVILAQGGGNVGIGTASPAKRLDVNGDVQTNGTVQINGNGLYNSRAQQVLQTNSTDYFRINQNGTYTNGTAAYGTWQFGSGNVAIGTWTPSASYKLQVIGSFYAGGSSRDYKENIIPLTLDPSRIYELEPMTYDYKDEYKHLGKTLSGGRQFGLIAEDVYKVYPELTLNDGVKNVANVDYEKLGVLLLAEMKNQKKEIDSLKAKNIELEKRIEKIEQLLK